MCKFNTECPLKNYHSQCPHNPGLEFFRNYMSRSHEEIGVLMLKPYCFPVDPQGRTVQVDVEKAISDSQLNVAATACKKLCVDEVKSLYRDMFGFGVVDKSGNLELVRQRILEYLVGGCILSFLLNGPGAVSRATAIKTSIRTQYGCVRGSTEVRNIIHSPDPEDIINCLGLLFLSNGHNA